MIKSRETKPNHIGVQSQSHFLLTGHWPRHFKESTSVIIPKPNKPSYSTPKAFRPIILLNTLGKLIEKMISNRFQHHMIKFDIVDPNQWVGCVSAPPKTRASSSPT